MPYISQWNLQETVSQIYTMDDRFTMANMAIEAGAKNGIFDVDDKTIEYIKNHSKKPYKIYAG